MVLTSYQYPIRSDHLINTKRSTKKDPPVSLGTSNLLLIVNNWAFVKDTQNDVKVRPCELSDFQVQLKLSSTAFRSPQNPDCDFPFDKQAANFPYDSYVQLMKSASLKTFIAEVQELYEETEGKISPESAVEGTSEIGVTEDDEDVHPPKRGPKSKKQPPKRSRQIDDDDDDDDDDDEEEEDEDPPIQVVVKPKPSPSKRSRK